MGTLSREQILTTAAVELVHALDEHFDLMSSPNSRDEDLDAEPFTDQEIEASSVRLVSAWAAMREVLGLEPTVVRSKEQEGLASI